MHIAVFIILEIEETGDDAVHLAKTRKEKKNNERIEFIYHAYN